MKRQIRLYNFLIDSIFFFILVIFFSMALKDFVDRGSLKYIMIIIYYFYYFILEFTFGQTIGKMITKTKVCNSNSGKKPEFNKILIRTLSRLIPIDFISYLFIPNGLHDILSKTELKQK